MHTCAPYDGGSCGTMQDSLESSFWRAFQSLSYGRKTVLSHRFTVSVFKIFKIPLCHDHPNHTYILICALNCFNFLLDDGHELGLFLSFVGVLYVSLLHLEVSIEWIYRDLNLFLTSSIKNVPAFFKKKCKLLAISMGMRKYIWFINK